MGDRSLSLERKVRVWIKTKIIRPGMTIVLEHKYYVTATSASKTIVIKSQKHFRHDVINYFSTSIGLLQLELPERAMSHLRKGVEFCKDADIF